MPVVIQPRTKVGLVFDTDVEDRKALDKNIEMLKKYCSNITVINMMQVLDFEDEIVRSTDVGRAQDLTKSRSVSNFKTDFCRMKVNDCRSLMERYQFDIKKMWTAEPPTAFMDLNQESYRGIKLASAKCWSSLWMRMVIPVKVWQRKLIYLSGLSGG